MGANLETIPDQSFDILDTIPDVSSGNIEQPTTFADSLADFSVMSLPDISRAAIEVENPVDEPSEDIEDMEVLDVEQPSAEPSAEPSANLEATQISNVEQPSAEASADIETIQIPDGEKPDAG